MRALRPALPLLILVLAATHGAAEEGRTEVPPVTGLAGTYYAPSKTVTLTWQPGGEGEWSFRAYREAGLLGTTARPTYQDVQVPSGRAIVYVVTASRDGQVWSAPTAIAVPTISCEVVTTSTSWHYPYLFVHVHEECLGMSYDRDMVWKA